MLRRSWIVIGLLLLLAFPFTAQTPPQPAPKPDRGKECVETCYRKADRCYKNCESALRKCNARVDAKCAKIKDGKAKESCRQDAKRECSDEKEINCDGQCSVTLLQCTLECEKTK